MLYPQHLLKLIYALKRLPGVGNKSAERFAFHLLGWSETHLNEIKEAIEAISTHIKHCSQCGCIQDMEACLFCHESRLDAKKMCVVASARDVFAIEATHTYKGLYHVLGALLSPIHGKGPEHLAIDALKQRLIEHQIQEVVFALDSTLEGDATSLYLKKELEPLSVHVSRLAFGMPMGSSLDYVDSGTLARALSNRSLF